MPPVRDLHCGRKSPGDGAAATAIAVAGQPGPDRGRYAVREECRRSAAVPDRRSGFRTGEGLRLFDMGIADGILRHELPSECPQPTTDRDDKMDNTCPQTEVAMSIATLLKASPAVVIIAALALSGCSVVSLFIP